MPFLSTLGGGSNKGFLDQGQAIFNATGGSISTYTSGGKTWRSHTFLNSGTFSVSSGSNNLEVLIVAGGGGGGDGGGGDKGGGGGSAGACTDYGSARRCCCTARRRSGWRTTRSSRTFGPTSC